MNKELTKFLSAGIRVVLSAVLISAQTFTLSALASEKIPLHNAPVPMGFAGTSDEPGLTPAAREAAELLGVLPKVQRLIQLKQSHLGPPSDVLSDQEMALKIDLLDKIMGAGLEVRMVSGRIDREIAWSFAGEGSLQAQRQKIINLLFTANFMQGGILGILSGPAFLHGKNTLGTEFLLLASSIGLGLSIMALGESMRGSKPIDGQTNILANIFHLSQTNPDYHSKLVFKFLNSVPPESTNNKTRAQILIESWEKGHYLHSTEEKHLQKLAEVQPKEGKYKENIRLLSNRTRMLFDTQWTVQQFDAELLELLRVTDQN